jgi:hypothetical protein
MVGVDRGAEVGVEAGAQALRSSVQVRPIKLM